MEKEERGRRQKGSQRAGMIGEVMKKMSGE